MGRSVAITSIVTAALAFASALMLSVDANFFLGIAGIVAAVFIFLQKEGNAYIVAALTILLSVVGSLGIIGSISGENGDIEFGISTNLGRAVLIVAMMAPVVYMVMAGWDTLTSWVRYVGAGAAGLTILLAFVFMGSLGDQTQTGSFVVAFLALASSVPGIMSLRA